MCVCEREIGDYGVTNDGIKLCSSSHLTGKEQGNTTCIPDILLFFWVSMVMSFF